MAVKFIRENISLPKHEYVHKIDHSGWRDNENVMTIFRLPMYYCK